MVRMSDLVRGPAPAAPLPESEVAEGPKKPVAPAAVTPAPAATATTAPAPSHVERPPATPARLTLRAIDMTTAPAPVSPVAPPRGGVARGIPPAAPPPSPAVAPAASVPGVPKTVSDDVQLFLAGVRAQIASGGAPAWPEAERLFQRIVDSLEASAELFWLANAPTLRAGVDYLVAHQTRVAILAARIGLNIGYDRPRAVALSMAGAFIDIALWQSPDAILPRIDALNAEEQAVYRAHPARAAALLAQWGAPAGLVDAVHQHHEREQGQGFPQRLSGNAICQDAKILGLVDAYTALTLPPSRKPGLRPHEAIREIVRSKRESFSPVLIKALLSEISVFPPGTLVRLNTGEVGQVTAVNRNHPLRPRVEVVSDAKGNRPLAPKTIDLSEMPFLYITGPVSETTSPA
jgi:hypothetical protein